MSNENETKKLLKDTREWGLRIGRNVALSQLVLKRVGPRTAERLLDGDYGRKPSPMLTGILHELIYEADKAS